MDNVDGIYKNWISLRHSLFYALLAPLGLQEIVVKCTATIFFCTVDVVDCPRVWKEERSCPFFGGFKITSL